MSRFKLASYFTIIPIFFTITANDALAQFIKPFSATPMPSTMLQGNNSSMMNPTESYGAYQPRNSGSSYGMDAGGVPTDESAAEEQARLEKIQNSEVGADGAEETCSRAKDEPPPAVDMTYGGTPADKKKKDPCASKLSSASISKQPQTNSGTSQNSLKVGTVLTGNASIITGDTLRVEGTTIHLAGIEAPPPGEVCRSGATAWQCGDDATEHLQDVAGGRRVACTIQSEKSDVTGKKYPDATCSGASGIADLSLFQAKQGNALGTAPETRAAMMTAKLQKSGIWLSP